MSERSHEEDDCPDEVIQGKNSEGTPYIEVPIPVDFVLAVVKDSGDEEAGENEKDIDPSPAPTEDKGVTGTVVLKEHHNDSDCAEAV